MEFHVNTDDYPVRAVKEKILKLVEGEDSSSPLSDQKIVDILRIIDGIDIRRRTVAKYRDQMNILPARYRKSL
jgi:RNA polymerase sigma-54 factor